LGTEEFGDLRQQFRALHRLVQERVGARIVGGPDVFFVGAAGEDDYRGVEVGSALEERADPVAVDASYE
jgi:hypothetical protein